MLLRRVAGSQRAQCVCVTILGQNRLSEERGTNEVLRTRKVSQGYRYIHAAGVKDVKLKGDIYDQGKKSMFSRGRHGARTVEAFGPFPRHHPSLQTSQPHHDSLVPFDHCTLNSIGLEKSEYVRGSVVCILGGGGSGMSRNPNHDGAGSVLPVFAVGNETSCLDGRVANLPSFQELADLGSDSVPDSVERCVEDSIDGLGREMSVSALGDGDGIFEEIRAVEEVGMVGRDTMVVSGSLPVRYIIWGDSGAIRGDGECRAVGRRLAQGRGGR